VKRGGGSGKLHLLERQGRGEKGLRNFEKCSSERWSLLRNDGGPGGSEMSIKGGEKTNLKICKGRRQGGMGGGLLGAIGRLGRKGNQKKVKLVIRITSARRSSSRGKK